MKQHPVLRIYALTMCLLTALAFCLLFSGSAWDFVLYYVERIENNDVVEYVTTGQIQPACDGCAATTAEGLPSLLAPPQAVPHFVLYDEKGEGVAREYRPAPPTAPPAETPLFVYKSIISLIAAFIFLTHWRLYKNLRAVAE